MKFEHAVKLTKKNDMPFVNTNTDDPFFVEIFSHGGFIAGGYARYVVSQKPFAEPADIDVFCFDKEDAFPMLKQFFDEIGIVEFSSPFAISYRINKRYRYITKKVQLIIPREEGNIKTYGTPQEVIDNFDFTINMIAFDYKYFYEAHEFAKHNEKHKLVFNNIHCAVGILTRLRKYLRKGYKITVAEMLKIYGMWDTLPEADKNLIMNTFREDWFDEDDDDETIQKKYENVIRDNEQVFKIFYVD